MILGGPYDNPQTMDEQHRFALAFLQQQQQQQQMNALHSVANNGGVDHASVGLHQGVSVNASGGWGHLGKV